MGREAFFITTDELMDKLGDPNLRIVDASWFLPDSGRDAKEEFEEERIPGAVYFDIDALSDDQSPYPHMLMDPDRFAKAVGALGISETNDIVVYDRPGMFSSARVWWNFVIMGAPSVRILEGGYDRWELDDGDIDEDEPTAPEPTIFTPSFNADMVKSTTDILASLEDDKHLVLDARAAARFEGSAPEPREGLRSGHIPGAISMPFGDLVQRGTLLPIDQLKEKLAPMIEGKTQVTASCGSGVTAAIVYLALKMIGHDACAVYDGSWAEWGDREDLPLETGK